MRRLIALTAAALSAVAANAQHPQQSEALFVERFNSFKTHGYDALTAPPEWYRPVETVVGRKRDDDNFASPPAASERSISSAAIAAAAAYAEQQQSTALLIYHQGRLQYERYWQNDGRDSLFNPQSMSKTALGMMMGIAIRDGYVGSVDDRVDRYIDEWRNDPRGAITLAELMQMSGGLAQISSSYDISLDNPAVYQHFGTDFVAPILDLPLADRPGSRWEYNNNESNLLGVILQRASGRRYADYLSESLWAPLGLTDAAAYLDRPGGTPMFSCCILSRPIDWLKLGVLFLRKGEWDGQQIVPTAWIDAMTTPASTNAGYGYQVWLGNHAVASDRPQPSYPNQPYSSEPFADEETIVFRGFGYQRVWIMPTRGLVIMRAGKSWPPDWDNVVIPNTIYRGSAD